MRILNHPVIKEFDINTKGKDYFVGDIHGTFKRLNEALSAISFDKTKDRLFCSGDLFDRGMSHKDIIHYINQDWFHACLGNHDDMILNSFENMQIVIEEHDINSVIEIPIREMDEEIGKYKVVGYDKYSFEDYYKLGICYGERAYLSEFTFDELMEIEDYLKGLPLMMRVKTRLGDIGLVHAEIPSGKSFQETIDWVNEDAKNQERYDTYSSVRRKYLFWGERGRYLPDDIDLLFQPVFDFGMSQERLDKVLSSTARDLYLLYMGHNIMPVKEKEFHKEGDLRRLRLNTKHLKFIDHGSFVADQIETDAYGLGIYDDKGELVIFIDSMPL